MYEFLPASDLHGLIGEVLGHVRLYPYSTHFIFDRTQITVVFAIEHIEVDGSVWRYECIGHDGPAIMLHRVVGQTVTAIENENLRLKIRFANGAELHVLSEIGPHECGLIETGDGFILF